MNKLIFGNWKSNKNQIEAGEWFRVFSSKMEENKLVNNDEIVIFPPYTILSFLSGLIRDKRAGFFLGAQDVSPFSEGAYTGEISPGMLRGLVKYVLIGHSERREYFKEEYPLLKMKCDNSRESGLIPVFCVSDVSQPVPDSAGIVAYEPLSAIGTGKPESPREASLKISDIRKSISRPVIYGGSVNSSNIREYLIEDIDGVLPGKSSLDPVEFFEMIKNAS